MSDPSNGWQEWSRHVLKELERLNGNYDTLSSDINEIKGKLGSFSSDRMVELSTKMESLEANDTDQEGRLRELEKVSNKFSGKWAIIVGVGSVILAGVISFLFNVARPKAEPDNASEKRIEKTIRKLDQPGAVSRTVP